MKFGSYYGKSLIFPFLLVEVWSVAGHEGFGGVLLWRISWTIEAEAPVPNGLGLFCLVELEEHCTTTLEFQPFSIIPVKQ